MMTGWVVRDGSGDRWVARFGGDRVKLYVLGVRCDETRLRARNAWNAGLVVEGLLVPSLSQMCNVQSILLIHPPLLVIIRWLIRECGV